MTNHDWKKILCFTLVGLLFLLPILVDGSDAATPRIAVPVNPKQQHNIHGPITISGNPDFEVQGWPGSGTEEDPYIIADLHIINRFECIIIENTNAHFVIRNCLVKANNLDDAIGIHLLNVKNATLEGCSVSDGEWGIRLENSSDCQISNCTIFNCNTGVLFQGTSDSVLRDSSAYGCNFGVLVYSTVDCTLRSNRIFGNNVVGVSLDAYTNRCIVFGNAIGWNLAWSVSDNARDHGNSNAWNESSQGNAWRNYNGTETYPVAGNATAVDYHPTLLEDQESPQVNSPPDISYEYGAEGFAINWSFSDAFPKSIEIIRDNQTVSTREWYENDVSFSVDNLQHGVHNCTIRLTDWAGNQATDTVRVIVMYSIFGGLGTPYVLVSSILSVVAVAAVILLMIKTRG